jgi:hypothetical protein
MDRRRWVLLASFSVTILALLLAGPPASAAPSCTERTRGELTFVVNEGSFRSDTTLRFGSGTHPRDLVLVYAVAGCELHDGRGLRVRTLTSDASPATFGKARFDAEGNYLVVSVPVEPTAFEPGEHEGVVGLFGARIDPALEGVSLRRRYGDDAVIYAILASAIVIGILWCGLGLAAASGGVRLGVRLPYAPLAVAMAAAAAFGVFAQMYLASDTWNLTVHASLALFLGCAAAAAGGAASGAVAKAIVGLGRAGRGPVYVTGPEPAS